MQVELAIVEALLSANFALDKVKTAVEAVYKEIDRRYELHCKQLKDAIAQSLIQLGSDTIKPG